MKCPKCGKEEWFVTGNTHDTVEYYVDLQEDGTFDITDVKDEFVGETDWWSYVECEECGFKLDHHTMEAFEGDD